MHREMIAIASFVWEVFWVMCVMFVTFPTEEQVATRT